MKNFEIKKEIWIWVIMIVPLIYLSYVWGSLPEIVPTHFGMDGRPDDWSHKITLAYMIPGFVVGIYALFTVIPYIDPKGQIAAMGNKYYLLKLFMMLFITALSSFIIQSTINKNMGDSHLLFLLIGALLAFLGNYMQAMKPNYFIGIRTPWTLENEVVWRKTHQLGGKLFFVAGLLTMILPFILKEGFNQIMLYIIITAAAIPVAYSYIVFRQEKANQ